VSVFTYVFYHFSTIIKLAFVLYIGVVLIASEEISKALQLFDFFLHVGLKLFFH
jgi:hypothetical protein